MIERDYDDCPECHGTGTIDTRDTICEITKDGAKMYKGESE
jgi:RecJ-like exonuclease